MKFKHLSVEERELLQTLRWEKRSIRHIAGILQRSPSSISRELGRNVSSQHQIYTPRIAQERAVLKRKSRGRTKRLKNDRVRAYVTEHLKQRWSPEQIAGCIQTDIGERVCHEAIYQYVYAQIHRGGYGYLRPGCEDLRPFLRRKQKRRQRHGMRKAQRIFRPKGRPIDIRPAVVDRRSRIGDWEGDTVESRDHLPGINTLVERKTGYVLITKLDGKTASATTQAMQRLRSFPRHTVTLDNGTENSGWEQIESSTGVRVYYAHPYHSWERGTNENTNGLIREYFPKGTDFRTIPEADIQRVEHLLNTRPRKRLGYRTPLQVMRVAIRG